MKKLIPTFLALAACLTGTAANASEHRWVDAGTALFTDDLIRDAITENGTSRFELYTCPVALERDADNAGYYRLADPYGPANPLYEKLAPYRRKAGDDGHSYIVVNATDPDNVIIEQSGIGLFIDDEELFVFSYNFMENSGRPEFSTVVIDMMGLRGKLRDNAITFTTPNCFILSYPSLYNSSQIANFYGNNGDGSFRIELPAVSDNPGGEDTDPDTPDSDKQPSPDTPSTPDTPDSSDDSGSDNPGTAPGGSDDEPAQGNGNSEGDDEGDDEGDGTTDPTDGPSAELPEDEGETEGITDATADSDTTPTLYYNLHGIRIEKPRDGQTVIRVGGGKSAVVRFER